MHPNYLSVCDPYCYTNVLEEETGEYDSSHNENMIVIR